MNTMTKNTPMKMGLFVMFALVAAPVAAHAATIDALWQFEETSGSPLDAVAGHSLNNVGASLNVAGKFGSGAAFAGDGATAARFTTANAAGHAATQPTGDFSVLVWIRPTAADLTNDFNRFIDTSSNNGGITTGYRLFTGGGADTDNFRFLADAGANTSIVHSRDLLADTWTLLAVRYDTDGQATLNVLFDTDTVNTAFVTGNSQSTAATGSVNYNPGENTNFASQDTPDLNNEFDGRMDDAAFFTGLLTDAQIASVFNNGAAAVFVPAPAALPAGLLIIVGLAARRRR